MKNERFQLTALTASHTTLKRISVLLLDGLLRAPMRTLVRVQPMDSWPAFFTPSRVLITCSQWSRSAFGAPHSENLWFGLCQLLFRC